MRKFDVDLKKKQELGNYIKQIRKEKELTLSDISKKTKIALSDLHKIENGTKIKTNPFQLKALSEVLMVDYKIFYKMCGFLEEKDFCNGNLINQKTYLKEDLIKMLNTHYPKIDIKNFFNSLKDLKKSQIKEILLFIDFIKNREEIFEEEKDINSDKKNFKKVKK